MLLILDLHQIRCIQELLLLDGGGGIGLWAGGSNTLYATGCFGGGANGGNNNMISSLATQISGYSFGNGSNATTHVDLGGGGRRLVWWICIYYII